MKKIVLFLMLIISCILNAQDLHFSQYFRTPLFLNPAMTGSANEDMRCMFIARNQWQSITVPYNSIGASVDTKFPMKISNDKFGAGMQVFADRAGDSKYTTVQASLSGAYHLVTSGRSPMDLSIGGVANFYQRSYDPNQLKFDNQFNGDYFDPNIPINEQFDRLSLAFFDFGIGVNWAYTIEGITSIVAGSSIQHIASSEQNFLINSSNTLLQPKWNGYVYGDINVYKNLGVVPLFFYQTQDKKTETILGIGASINLAPKSNERNNLKLGTNLRLGDATIFWGQWEVNNMSVQLSYDLNTSPLTIASSSYGGIELSVGYLIQYRESKTQQHDYCPYIWF